MSDALTAWEVRALGRAEGDGRTLAVLTAGQHTRRLLLLRVLFDAARTAPREAAARARDHADLLEAAERAAPQAARRVLFYPLTGPWAERCVRRLDAGRPAASGGDLAHLGALAAAAATRAGVSFATRAEARGGLVSLPTLGALRCPVPDGTGVRLSGDARHLTIRAPALPPARVAPGPDGAWRSSDPRWLPLHTLPGGPRPVLLDDLAPAWPPRAAEDAEEAEEAGDAGGPGGAGRGGRGGTWGDAGDAPAPGALPAAERARWAELWRGALPLLRLGGAARAAELALLDCIVPLPGARGGGSATAADAGGAGPAASAAHSTSTRPDAFGAVLASPPPSPALLAAGLTHELQHAKLAALGELVPLHTAGPEPRHWAPWRPDPRPFDGLLHGAYAHLALAALWQRLALRLPDPTQRDHAWAAHARCRAQVGAVLPVLHGARRLTDAGRTFVGGLVEHHAQLAEPAPPAGHAVRAAAYVETARALWLRTHGGLRD